MENSLILVIFGATGNLYADKLAKALYILFEAGKLPAKFSIIGFARKDLTSEIFRASTKASILKKGEVNASKLDDFLQHIEYFQGNFIEKEDFVKLKDFILNSSISSPDTAVFLHIATASKVYKQVFENIQVSTLETAYKQTKILIEKPFGKDEADAKNLQNFLSQIFEKKDIFHVDHYLAKETAVGIFDFRWKAGSPEGSWNKEFIKKIKVSYLESNVVGSRGASYDAVGAFVDVGQNHMLELLALSTMEKPHHLDAQSIHASRAKALSDLYIDGDKKITKGQYEGYLSELGVEPHSKTDTFFRVFLKSKNPSFAGVEMELEGGKGLADMHSDIITTSVAVEIYFKSGEKKEFKIQPVAGTVYESYTKVYEDAFLGDQTLFVGIEEILAEWKITDELLEKWKNIQLTIYKKGSAGEDIK